jgi:central kinetochore subunit CTF19
MDPLDLFSDSARGAQLDQLSSPVTREQELAVLKQELLGTKAELTAEVDMLELEMNQLINKDKEEEEQRQKVEDDYVMRMLVEAENGESPEQEKATAVADEESDLSQYDVKPSRQWDTRLKYLKKFYPDIHIFNMKSSVSLEYLDDKKALIKNIEFSLNIQNLIKFQIHLKLNKFKTTYQVFDFLATKTSNNKLNTLLLDISTFFCATKNINSFLLTLNNLDKLLQQRRGLFQNSEEWNHNGSILTNSMSYKSLTLYYDIIFDNGELQTLYSTNQSRLSPVMDLYIKSYGMEIGLKKFIHEADVLLSEVVSV